MVKGCFEAVVNVSSAVMSGRRPVVKGCFEAVVNVSSAVMSTACVVKGCFEAVVNVSSAVMSTACRCGRDVSAGPDDSSAWLFASSFARARIGADRYSGFQAFSVGSHHFVGALDADRTLGGENSLSNSSFVRSSRDRPIVVVRPPSRRHVWTAAPWSRVAPEAVA